LWFRGGNAVLDISCYSYTHASIFVVDISSSTIEGKMERARERGCGDWARGGDRTLREEVIESRVNDCAANWRR